MHIIKVVYGEFLQSTATPECLEVCDGDTGGASHKLEQSETLFTTKALHSLPEPYHHLVSSMIACRGLERLSNTMRTCLIVVSVCTVFVFMNNYSLANEASVFSTLTKL